MNTVAEPLSTTARVVPLAEAVELNPRPDRGSLPDDLDVSFVPMAAVEAATGRMEATAVRRFGEVRKGYTVFREGDVLFAKITPCMENGKMAIARGLHNGIGCGSTEFHVLRPRPGVDAQYVYHFVSSARFRAEAAHHMTGAVGQKRVPAAFLEQCEIPLPDLDEQRRIVAEMERQFSRLDEAVANLKRVKANLKRNRAAVLKAAVEGRLAPTEAELAPRQSRRYETGAELQKRLLEERRSKWGAGAKFRDAAEPRHIEGLALPEGWTWASLEQLCTVFVDSAHRTPKYGEGIYPAIGPRDVVGGALNLERVRLVNESEYLIQVARHIPKPGDVVYSRELSLGWGAVLPAGANVCLSQGMCLFRPTESISAKYFLTVLNAPLVRRQADSLAAGSAHPHLNLSDIKALAFPLPPRTEQDRIVDEVERLLTGLESAERTAEESLARAQALRRAVLSSAFPDVERVEVENGVVS